MIKMKSQIDPRFSFDRGVAAFAHTWGPGVSGSRLWRANCLGEVRLKHILMDHIVTHTETHWYTSKIEMCIVQRLFFSQNDKAPIQNSTKRLVNVLSHFL